MVNTTGLNHITNPQSGQGGDRGISIDASWLNQGGGGGTSLHDQPAVVDGTSNKAHASCRGKSFLMRTGLIVLCTIRNLNSWEHVTSRKICKRSYTSGNLRGNGNLTTGEDDTNSMASSVWRFLKSLKRPFYFWLGLTNCWLWLWLSCWFWLINNCWLL